MSFITNKNKYKYVGSQICMTCVTCSKQIEGTELYYFFHHPRYRHTSVICNSCAFITILIVFFTQLRVELIFRLMLMFSFTKETQTQFYDSGVCLLGKRRLGWLMNSWLSDTDTETCQEGRDVMRKKLRRREIVNPSGGSFHSYLSCQHSHTAFISFLVSKLE